MITSAINDRTSKDKKTQIYLYVTIRHVECVTSE